MLLTSVVLIVVLEKNVLCTFNNVPTIFLPLCVTSRVPVEGKIISVCDVFVIIMLPVNLISYITGWE